MQYIFTVFPFPVQSNLLPCPQFHELARRVQDSGITFIIEPHLRFEGVRHDQFSICTSYRWIEHHRHPAVMQTALHVYCSYLPVTHACMVQWCGLVC